VRTAILAAVVSIVVAGAEAQQSLTPEQQDAIRQSLGLPPGSTITIETTETKDGGFLKIEEEATGIGAGFSARGDKVVSDFNASAPAANLVGKGQSAGGDTSSKSTVVGSTSLWLNPLFWFGILSILVAVATLLVRPPVSPVAIPLRATAIIGIVGIGFIAAALFPGILLFLVAATGLVLLVPYVQREFAAAREQDRAQRGAAATKALRSVAAGVADFKRAASDPTNPIVPPESWVRLKQFLESHVEPDEKSIIENIRREDNLG
jgi:hypothetical protein